ncbi:DUF916 and DUF3324 domain-containing protein [Vagococcus hydrophili]|uniref:DUF916 and DUF3324 domain-containing protein n=1 Tax=Vagococcus hydrophili TaxID=2714947 RepID=A0A6G8ATJ3_9ENTE|nr:DUF916 and DUF3324 domain-containing protein [Vagococcus hydrophili]QIL48398.1 DUF916 and DUF3324 domain-containing protein [Vagococcus hydrophili]
MIKKKGFLSFLVIVIGVLFLSNTSTAADTTVKNSGKGADFGVSVIYPDNQFKETGQSGYFDLRVKPGDKQTIKIKVNNISKKEINVQAKLNRGMTNDNGLLDYSLDKKKDTQKLEDNINFYKIASIKEEKIKVPANASKEVSIDLEIPKDEFRGTVLGGVYFTQTDELSKEDQKRQVVNAFAYAVPIVLKESDETIKNKMSLGKVEPNLRNYHPYIEAELINESSALIKSLKVEGRITDKKAKEDIYVKKEEKLQMAPNSNFKFGFDMKDTATVPGDYHLKMKIEADGQPYEFEKDFKITKDQAKKINEDSVYLTKEDNNKWLIIALVVGGVVLLIIIVVVILLVRKNKKAKKKTSKKKSSSQKKSNNKKEHSKKGSSSSKKGKSSSEGKRKKHK